MTREACEITREDIMDPKGWELLSFIMDARTGLGRFRDFNISNYQLMMALIDFCRDKQDIAENVIRRLLTYGIGRELNYRDRYDVEKILSQSKENGFLLQDMIVSICQSSTFRGTTNNK